MKALWRLALFLGIGYKETKEESRVSDKKAVKRTKVIKICPDVHRLAKIAAAVLGVPLECYAEGALRAAAQRDAPQAKEVQP
jgi:predicted HicB family RNase H-like nuclease